MKRIISQVFISLLVSGTMIGVYHFLGQGNEDRLPAFQTSNNQDSFAVYTNYAPETRPSYTRENIPADFRTAAKRSMPAVVHIKSFKKPNYRYQSDPFFEFFGVRPRRQGSQELYSTGSGVVISSDGYIVTNNHVIADGDRLEVTLYDNRSYMATVIGTDPATDLGLIRIEENGLPFIELANSDQAEVGEWVLAVGNPFNLASTATAGIVSAIGRELEIIKDRAAIESFIQTDAAVNPGNSGGALVDLDGRLLGINTAIASPTGAYAGYAFAVPANIVRKVVGDLREFGSVQRGFLGIQEVYSLNANLARELGVEATEGVMVVTLSRGGAAEQAGMRKGDIIIEADGLEVSSDTRLKEILARKRPGDRLELTVDRDGQIRKFVVSLTNREGTTEILADERSELLNQLGAEFIDLSNNELRELARYDINGGAKISKLYAGKIRQATDIQEGFVILKVNDVPVSDANELTQMLENARGTVKLVGYYPRSTRLFSYSLKL